MAAATNRLLTTGQVGFLLGYLGSRVLGQYDVALLSAEQEPGRLLYVEENIRATARLVKVPARRLPPVGGPARDDPRLRARGAPLAAAVPPQPPGAPGRPLRARDASVCSDMVWHTSLAAGARAAAEGSLRGFLGPEQRQLFKETQLVMSLMEGFSDWVMDEVGAELLPDVDGIRRRFEARRGQRRRAIDRLMARITGMDMKLEQYRRGERFVSGVYRVGGAAAIDHLWDGPETLPTDREMDDPAAWVRRVAAGSARARGRPHDRSHARADASRPPSR